MSLKILFIPLMRCGLQKFPKFLCFALFIYIFLFLGLPFTSSHGVSRGHLPAHVGLLAKRTKSQAQLRVHRTHSRQTHLCAGVPRQSSTKQVRWQVIFLLQLYPNPGLKKTCFFFLINK